MLRPKKIIQKNKIQKNKNKRELKAFEIKEAAYLYYEEPEQKSYTLNINKLFQINYSSTICDWFTHTEYKELIYDYIKFKILSSDLPFSVILKTGINFGWDISQMNEKFSSINISSNEKHNKTYKIIEESICEICQEQKKEFYSLECSHKFCINCYRNYIKQNLQENKHTIVKKTCPNKDCEVKIDKFLCIS